MQVVVTGEAVLPPEVQHLVLQCIPSVAHLEALLLLRSRAKEELAVETIARALFIDPSAAAQVLAHLVARRLVWARSSSGPFRFAPAPDREKAVEQLAETYRTRLVPLSRFIHENAGQQGIRDFADAFRLRKKE
jgi:predicted ArsR family transcriptional regulator